LATGRTPSLTVKRQVARSTRGVGPAERTGKSSVRYCPGGRRSPMPSVGLLPVKPRVAIVPLHPCRWADGHPSAIITPSGDRLDGLDQFLQILGARQAMAGILDQGEHDIVLRQLRDEVDRDLI